MRIRPSVNLTMPLPLISAAKKYCDANERNFSEFVSDLVRRHLEKLNIPCDAVQPDLTEVKKVAEFQPKPSTKSVKTALPVKSAGPKRSHG